MKLSILILAAGMMTVGGCVSRATFVKEQELRRDNDARILKVLELQLEHDRRVIDVIGGIQYELSKTSEALKECREGKP